jgi:hypothetical protein
MGCLYYKKEIKVKINVLYLTISFKNIVILQNLYSEIKYLKPHNYFQQIFLYSY